MASPCDAAGDSAAEPIPSTPPALPPSRLHRPCDPQALDFETTAELDPPEASLGQNRAEAALSLAVGMSGEGYNAYVMGPEGSGRHRLVLRAFERAAASRPAPPDLCYVHDFAQPHRPRLLRLPPGTGRQLEADMAHLIEELSTVLPGIFESDDYHQRRQAIEKEHKERQNEALSRVQEEAESRDLAMVSSPMGLVFAPTGEQGIIDPEAFQELPEEEKARIAEQIRAMQALLQRVLRQVPRWEREMRARVRALDREVTDRALRHLIDELRERYAGLPAVTEHLSAVQGDIIDAAPAILQASQQEPGTQPPRNSPGLKRYAVNVLIDHGQSRGAPVCYEDHPTLSNLVGRVEHEARMGALSTDFTHIKPGVLHRASGGYLVLDARRLLGEPMAWDALKRALSSAEVRIEAPGEALGLVSTVSLEPEPAPLELRLALVGDRWIHGLLSALDPDFERHFKVAADFDEVMPRDPAGERRYAQLCATVAREHGLPPFDRAAVARLVEEAAREAEDALRLSTRVEGLVERMREAAWQAGRDGQPQRVTARDVERATAAGEQRGGRLRERTLEAMLRGTLLIDTEGARVGQVNGLSVLQLGRVAFGRPSRITARVRLGKGQVLDIEREVELGGPLHSKGVLILSSLLAARYAGEHPLSLSASLVFEQSYGGIDGDSASSAELYALLSALSGLPIDQGIAVTGSVSQHGEVQPIGGVNHKIEGFFALCAARGLTGRQGVLIPAANVEHLMLRGEVIEAVEAGRFHIWPVSHVDEGIERLTGVPAGRPDGAGRFPSGSVNAGVARRLATLARLAREAKVPARTEAEPSTEPEEPAA